MACELTVWMQMLALDGPARAWEPKRLRLRLFTTTGASSAAAVERSEHRPDPGDATMDGVDAGRTLGGDARTTEVR